LQREQDEEECRAVADQEGDAVAPGDAERGQAGGDSRDLALGLGVGPAAFVADQSLVRRPLGDGGANKACMLPGRSAKQLTIRSPASASRRSAGTG
jgi:hypothetical protein